MYKLYWSPGSGAFAAQAALEEANAGYERVTVDLEAGEQRSDEFLALNPRGQVPALVLPDGTVMTESAAMVLHIADCYPWAGLLPPPGDPDRARVYRWLVFAVANLYEADLRYFYPERYTTDEAGVAAVKAAGLRDMDRAFGLVEAALGGDPHLLGEIFSAADLYLLMLAYWHPERQALFERCPGLARLCAEVRARPAIERIWNENFGDE